MSWGLAGPGATFNGGRIAGPLGIGADETANSAIRAAGFAYSFYGVEGVMFNAGAITTSQYVTATGGYNFNTVVPQINANILDSYLEVASFLPVDTSGAGLVFTAASGKCTKIGDVVTGTIKLTYPVTANASAARVSLPYVTGWAGDVFPAMASGGGLDKAIGQVAGDAALWDGSGYPSNAAMSGKSIIITFQFKVN